MERNRALVRPALRPFLFGLGWLAFALGFIGAFVPILPTTPFLILAGFCFSKSSPKVHDWILELPAFGPMILDWEMNRVIRPKAKVWATGTLTALIWASILFAGLSLPLKLMLGVIWLSVGIFILTRKSR